MSARSERLLELAARVEAAAERVDVPPGLSEQRALLIEAWFLIHGRPSRTEHEPEVLRFSRQLDAEAYESAAMQLVPEGWRLAGMSDVGGQFPKASAAINDKKGAGVARADAATPALALCSASLRALAATGGDHA